MIIISKDQPLYKYIKRKVYENTAIGYKKFAKENYEDLLLVFDDGIKKLRLHYNEKYFIPQQNHRKSDFEKYEDSDFKKYMLNQKGV